MDPATSAKSTVTCLRSPSGGAAVGGAVAGTEGVRNGVPQCPQKRCSVVVGLAQDGHANSEAPHWVQKRSPASLGWPHEPTMVVTGVRQPDGASPVNDSRPRRGIGALGSATIATTH
jgi:hypothetical protein